jgi:hypothetical protein
MRQLLVACLLIEVVMPEAVQAAAERGIDRSGLEDLVGARAGQAEAELRRRGYRNARAEEGDDRSYTYWWSEDRRQCVTIATMNGRYDSITPTTAPDCRKSGAAAAHHGQSRSNDRYRADRPSSRRTYDGTELQARCRSEAADRYDLRPSELTVNAPINQRTGSTVQGWFDTGRRTTFFTCRFDSGGRFVGVF